METTEDQGFTAKNNKKTKISESKLNGEQKDEGLSRDENNMKGKFEEADKKEEASGASEGENKVQSGPEVLKEADDQNFRNKYYYLAAEMENFKKRTQKEKENLLKYANEKLLLDLLDVVDNFDRTLTALRKDEDKKIQNIVAGIDMVSKQFSGILQKYDLTPVESVGKEFDPNFHEAVAQKSIVGREDNEIIEEYQKGYLLNGRLLRPSKVMVAKSEET